MTDNAYRAGFVAVVGRPNVGKSTLMNRLIGQKLSITSPKPQTTRHRIHGVVTNEQTQIVYVDTPGMHLGAEKSLNRMMNRTASGALSGVDVIVMVVEADRWTREDEAVAEKCEHQAIPLIIAVNKIDLFPDKYALLPFLEKIGKKVRYDEIIPLSAYNQSGIKTLQEALTARLPEQPMIFPEETLTDRSTRFLASEIIREKLMRLLGAEVPYGVTVEIERFQWDDEADRWEIHGLILVERPGQKMIVIGKKGQLIKQVGIQARKDMMHLMDARVHLELWVKVKENWADDDRALASLGYDPDV
ncbi:GTPase Era [Thiomicrospira sp. WB1]|uniref:GTPase Era n=1 Tax=Thiomicrospira sp. WB1 TaxID=1685380 RepID=UPI000747E5A7|nr:GTPase Era [Thiomicrospira sp. WB1]KUJ71884.1 GTPase Era [Thiomicrospira sp. WB1]